MIQAHYREDYPGEFIVIETRWAGGKKHQSREWVPNPIENQHISGRAACIGSDVDQEKLDHTKLQRHRGGLLSSKKLQTYGVGHVAKQMRLDFAVESDVINLEELMNLNYHDKNIIYTTTKNCLKYPENFYIVPHRFSSIDPVLAVYLAAFDQHKEIFLLGYNKEVFVDSPNWQLQLDQIFSAYSGVSFFLVGERTNMFPQWFEHANVNHLDHRQFVIYCDV